MPCDSVTTLGLVLEKMNPGTLQAGLTADGHKVNAYGDCLTWYDSTLRQTLTYNSATGELQVSARRVQSTDQAASAVKQSFSRQLVRQQAAKFGWKMQQNGNKFVIQKGF